MRKKKIPLSLKPYVIGIKSGKNLHSPAIYAEAYIANLTRAEIKYIFHNTDMPHVNAFDNDFDEMVELFERRNGVLHLINEVAAQRVTCSSKWQALYKVPSRKDRREKENNPYEITLKFGMCPTKLYIDGGSNHSKSSSGKFVLWNVGTKYEEQHLIEMEKLGVEYPTLDHNLVDYAQAASILQHPSQAPFDYDKNPGLALEVTLMQYWRTQKHIAQVDRYVLMDHFDPIKDELVNHFDSIKREGYPYEKTQMAVIQNRNMGKMEKGRIPMVMAWEQLNPNMKFAGFSQEYFGTKNETTSIHYVGSRRRVKIMFYGDPKRMPLIKWLYAGRGEVEEIDPLETVNRCGWRTSFPDYDYVTGKSGRSITEYPDNEVRKLATRILRKKLPSINLFGSYSGFKKV